MLLFSGSSNTHLAQKVAETLHSELGKVDLNRFSDGEIRPWIAENVRDQTVYVLQSFSQPMNDHIMEFILMGDAIRRGAPKRLIGIIPYFGYARQDKQHRMGEPVSARIVAKLVEVVPYNEIITVDLHNDAIVGFFRIPVIHRSALPIVAHTVPTLIEGEGIVVSPDVGGVRRARNMAYQLDTKLVVMEKKRQLDRHDESEAFQIIGDVKDKTAILVDDIISTGGTIVHSAEALKEAGARKVIVCASHGVLSGDAVKRLNDSCVDIIIISDSIATHKSLPAKFHVISIAPLLADAVKIISGEE